MTATKTRVFVDLDADRRVSELQLDRAKLLIVRSTAVAAAADATPFHPANAAGTFAYHHGTFALRLEFVGKVWRQVHPNGVEAIENEALKVRVVFANVDLACDINHVPKPRSDRGAGAQRLSQDNLFENLPTYAKGGPVDHDGWVVYFLMVDPNGAVELTCAAVSGGAFAQPVERIFLSDGGDLEREPTVGTDDKPVVEFDPLVTRKTA